MKILKDKIRALIAEGKLAEDIIATVIEHDEAKKLSQEELVDMILDAQKAEGIKQALKADQKKKDDEVITKKKASEFDEQVKTAVDESLKKIDNLIKDVAVQMIECPGTGKNILVKVRNKISITRIILNESEINSIINYFSKNAKIPVSEGVLNAAVGSLLISAVVSEYAGSRFIITKKSPYELIEGIRQ